MEHFFRYVHSFRYVPFQLMYGQQAYLQIDVAFQAESPKELITSYFKLKDKSLREYKLVFEKAEQTILKAQTKQQNHYDKKQFKARSF